jgi:hypothetical protein
VLCYIIFLLLSSRKEGDRVGGDESGENSIVALLLSSSSDGGGGAKVLMGRLLYSRDFIIYIHNQIIDNKNSKYIILILLLEMTTRQ